MYVDMDRADLAVDLRVRLGDWFRVLQLVKSGTGLVANGDAVMEDACNHIGDYYFDRQQWTQAAQYYTQSRHFERLMDCYYFSEDYLNLEKLLFQLPDDHSLLPVRFRVDGTSL
jgi:WD repeat-containing protein 35